MATVTPLFSEHTQIRQIRRDVPRSLRRLERWRGALKPREYRAKRAELLDYARLVPMLEERARQRAA